MKALIAVIAAATLCAAVFAPASAGAQVPYLTLWRAQQEAKSTAADVGEALYYETDWALDWSWWVESRWDARRMSQRKVVFDAQYTLSDLDGYQESCDYKIVVWRYRDGPDSELVTDGYVSPNYPTGEDCYESY